jgi:hypothetical protein
VELTNIRIELDKIPEHSILYFISVTSIKHRLDFSFVLSAVHAPRNLFLASRIFCNGRYEPGCHYLFPKSEKIPALLHLGKGPE